MFCYPSNAMACPTMRLDHKVWFSGKPVMNLKWEIRSLTLISGTKTFAFCRV